MADREDRRTTVRHRRTRAFLVLDALLGTIMAVIMLMAITAAIIKQAHAEKDLAATRTVNRQLETALLALQTAGRPPQADFHVELLTAPAPAGYQWVRLSQATHALVGLVPAKNLPAGTGPAKGGPES